MCTLPMLMRRSDWRRREGGLGGKGEGKKDALAYGINLPRVFYSFESCHDDYGARDGEVVQKKKRGARGKREAPPHSAPCMTLHGKGRGRRKKEGNLRRKGEERKKGEEKKRQTPRGCSVYLSSSPPRGGAGNAGGEEGSEKKEG